MSFANVFLGNTAGDGTGDPIRVAFQKINLNFANIAAGNITVNAPVKTVAGRTGNVVLTVTDVTKAASLGYVDATGLSSNVYALSLLGNVTSNVQAAVSANLAGNITALLTSNSAVANITSNVNAAVTTAVYANITNIVGTVMSGNLAQINANVAGANAAITTANTGMKAYVDAVTTAWTANAATQAGLLATLQSNAGVQADAITGATAATATANTAMKGYVDAVTTAWTANAATQQGLISAVQANVGGFYTWANLNFGNSSYANANVAAYLPTATVITALQANIGGYYTWANANVSGLYSSILGANAATVTANTALKAYTDAQITTTQGQITTANSALKSYVDAQVTNLTANDVVQSSQIVAANAAIVTANTAMKAYVDAVTGANAAAQQSQIVALQANLGVTQIWANANVAGITANLGSYYIWANANTAGLYASITGANVAWQANSTAQQATINSLVSNAAIQDSAIVGINANVTAANAQISAISYTVSQLSGLGGVVPTLANIAQITAANAAIAQVNANVTAANATIASGLNTVNTAIGILQGQATSFTGSISTLQANSVSQESEISSLTGGLTGANAAIVTANTAMKTYVDAANTIQSGQIATLVSQVNNVAFYSNASIVAGWLSSNVASLNGNLTTANTAMKGYVDAVTTAWTANAQTTQGQLTGANAAIVTANTAMKAYVDAANTIQSGRIATLQGQVYTNSNTAVYLTTATGNIAAGNITVTNKVTTGNIITTNGIFWANGAPYAPPQPPISMYNITSNAGPISTNTYTLIYNNKNVDTNNFYNTSTGVFQPNVAGYYQIEATFFPSIGSVGTSLSDGTNFFLALYKNNTTVVAQGPDIVLQYAGLSGSPINTIVALNGTTDYLQVKLFATVPGSGVYYTGNSQAEYFQAMWLRGL